MDHTATTDLNLENIEEAAHVIDPVFLDSPQFEDEQLCAALGRRVVVKVETTNPIRSFKGRGAHYLFSKLDPKVKVVCASAGNFGQAVGYAGRRRGMAVEVFVPTDVNPIKVTRMESFGAKVTISGADFDAAKQNARQQAAAKSDSLFVEDGEDPAICEGAGTIGRELLRVGDIDTFVIPLGDGALITGIGAWVKQHSPKSKIIGVCPAGAPAMEQSWRAGKVVTLTGTHTIADGIAVGAPVARSLDRVRSLVDDIVLVEDSQLIDAMRLALSTLGIILEPSGAAGLAAIRTKDLPGDRLATVLTGGNAHPDLLAKIFG
jgi:threonine dehydratase